MDSSGKGRVRTLSVVCLHNKAIVARGIMVNILHCGTPASAPSILLVMLEPHSMFFSIYRREPSVFPISVDVVRCVSRTPCPSPVPCRRGVFIDVATIHHSVDRLIMTDRERAHVGLSPRDLYVKSNPGLLRGVDFTNPRDWYNTHAHKYVLESIGQRTPTLTSPSPDNKVAVVTFPVLNNLNADKRRTVSHHSHARNAADNLASKSAKSDSFAVLNGNHMYSNRQTSADESEDDVFQQSGIFSNHLPAVSSPKSKLVNNEKGDKTTTFALPYIQSIDQKYKVNNNNNNYIKTRKRPNGRTVFIKDTDKHKHTDANHKMIQMDNWFKKIPDQTQMLAKRQAMHEHIKKKLTETMKNNGCMTSQYPDTRRVGGPQRVSEKYQELILPKSDIETGEVERLHKNYSLHQKSRLKLKLTPKKRDVKQTSHSISHDVVSPGDGGGNSAFNKRRDSNIPKRIPTNHAMASICEPQVANAAGNLLVDVYPVSPAVKHDVISGNNGDMPPSETQDAEIAVKKATPQSTQENRRYVYKAPDDGFVYSMNHQKERNRTAVINMSIAKKTTKRPSHPLFLTNSEHINNQNIKTQESTVHKEAEHAKQDEQNDAEITDGSEKISPLGGASSALSGRISKKSHHSESKNSYGSAKSAVLKYNKLEVFAEKRKHDTVKLNRYAESDTQSPNDENNLAHRGSPSRFTSRISVYKLDNKTPASGVDGQQTKIDLQTRNVIQSIDDKGARDVTLVNNDDVTETR